MEQRFERIEEQLVKRLDELERKGQTEPIKVTRIEVDPGDMRERLDAIERGQAEAIKLLQGIAQTQPDHGEKLDTLERGQQEIKQDIAAIHDVFVGDFDRIENSIGEVNATLSERFDHVDRHFGKIETTMATKDDIAGIKATQDLILQLLQQKPPEG